MKMLDAAVARIIIIYLDFTEGANTSLPFDQPWANHVIDRTPVCILAHRVPTTRWIGLTIVF
jgi:hypothetical protein